MPLAFLCLLMALLISAPMRTSAQEAPEEHRSIHRIEWESHGSTGSGGENEDALPPISGGPMLSEASPRLAKRVFGYRPYWVPADDYLSYDYTAITDLGYFGAEIDTATGGLGALHGWPTAAVIQAARARGIRVALVVTCFGSAQNSAILGNPSRQSRLVNDIVAAVGGGNGEGVNIDFEEVGVAQSVALVAFIQQLADRLHAAAPGVQLSMAVPAVDWSGTFDLAKLAGICDYLIMMAYDYHYTGSANAGAVSPLGGDAYNVARSVETYLMKGVPASKLLLGVPWYGYDWPVVDSTKGANTTGIAISSLYKDAEPAAQLSGKRFDTATSSPWYAYFTASGWHQIWYDDSLSLALKYRLVTQKQLAGIGIWALSYEGGRKEIWSGISQAFAVPSLVAKNEREEASLAASFERALEMAREDPDGITIQAFDLLGRQVPWTHGSAIGRTSGPPRLDLPERGSYIILFVQGSTRATYGITVD